MGFIPILHYQRRYTQSLLNDEGKYVYGYLHRLVAMAYIPNPITL